MTDTLEKSLWKWLKSGTPHKAHCQRIENKLARGVPDVEACLDDVSTWIELKVGKTQKNGWGLKHLTAQQQLWHWTRDRAGGSSWFLIQLGKERMLVPGQSAQALYTVRLNVSEPQLRLLGGVAVQTAEQAWKLILTPRVPIAPPP